MLSNNVDPSVPPLLSAYFTVCGKVNYCSNIDYLDFIKGPLQVMPKVNSLGGETLTQLEDHPGLMRLYINGYESGEQSAL